jgi:haloalkane dehalogenase
VAGHRLSAVDEGDGPVLLMLHGNPTWSFVYRDVVKALSPRFRCVALDLPGFGLSEAPAGFSGRAADIADVVQAAVDALDLRGAVLVAHDWGGPIGLRVVERRPDRFAGLALGNTWAWPITGDRHFERFAGFMGGAVGAFLTRHANLFVNVMVPVGHRRRRVGRDEMRHYRRALGSRSRRQSSAVLPREIVAAAPFLADVQAGLPSLATLPVLLTWADLDIAFRRQELDRWRGIFPDAAVERLSGVGHFSPSDAPGEVAAAISDWYDEHLR